MPAKAVITVLLLGLGLNPPPLSEAAEKPAKLSYEVAAGEWTRVKLDESRP